MSIEKIEDWLQGYCKDLNHLSSDDAQMAYRESLMSGGKRVRPSLCLEVGRVVRVEEPYLREICIAIELLHASSLIHDDLPSLDDSDYRRGKPSCHKKFGEATALLIGNTMISDAFRVVLNSKMLSDNVKVCVSSAFSHTFSALCKGQLLDEDLNLRILKKYSNISMLEGGELLDLLTSCHINKTGSLIAISSAIAAIVGSKEPSATIDALQRVLLSAEKNISYQNFSTDFKPEEFFPSLGLLDLQKDKDLGLFSNLYLWGIFLGLIFQVTDDILDSAQETPSGRVLEPANDTDVDGGSILNLVEVDEAMEIAQNIAQASSYCGNLISSFGVDTTKMDDIVSRILCRKY